MLYDNIWPFLKHDRYGKMDGNVDRQLNRQSENVLEGSVTNTLPTRQDTAQHSDGERKCLGQHLEGRPSDFQFFQKFTERFFCRIIQQNLEASFGRLLIKISQYWPNSFPTGPVLSVFSSESALCIRWPKYWSFSFSISPSNEYSGLISFRIDWLDLLEVQGTLKSLLQHHSSKTSILRHSAFFIVQLSHPYMTTGKNHSLN